MRVGLGDAGRLGDRFDILAERAVADQRRHAGERVRMLARRLDRLGDRSHSRTSSRSKESVIGHSIRPWRAVFARRRG